MLLAGLAMLGPFSIVHTGVVAPLLYSGPETLALGMLLFALAGWVSWMAYLRLDARSATA